MGLTGPARASPIQRRGEVRDMYDLDVSMDLVEIEWNLEMIIARMPKVSMDELPREYQHHIVGVPRRIRRLLCRVA